MIGDFALVLSVKEKKAVVLAPGGRFIQIKNRNFQPGQRILIEPSLLSVQDRAYIAFEETRKKLHRFADRLKYKGLIILSSLVILVPTSAYAASKYVPWTYVSMDTGGVSIQYQLNARGEVLSAEPLSDDAQTVINALPPVRFEKVEDTMDRTIKAIYPGETLPGNEQETVLIGISSRFGGGEKTVEAIKDHIEISIPADVSVEHLNWSNTQNARRENLSIGQYSRKMEKPEEFDKKGHPETMPVPSLPGNNETIQDHAYGNESVREEHPAQGEGPSAVKPEPNVPGINREETGPNENPLLQAPGENPPSDLITDLNKNEGTDAPREEISPLQQIPEGKGTGSFQFPSEPPQPKEMMPPEEGVPETPAGPENAADPESFMIAPDAYGTDEDRPMTQPGQSSGRDAPPKGNPNDGNSFFTRP